MYYDPSGKFAISTLVIIGFFVGAGIGSGASIIGQAAANDWNFNSINWVQVGLDGFLGGVGGALSMSPLG